jgi:hypothetical protein
MAASEQSDQVGIAASVAHSQGQQRRLSTNETMGTFTYFAFDSEPDLDLLSSSVNVSAKLPPKNRLRTTTNSERPLTVSTESVDNNNQLQGATTISQHEGFSEAATQYTLHHQLHENPVISYIESTSERSSTLGTKLESSPVSISEHDLPYELPPHGNVSIQEDTGSHQPTPPEITRESHDIANILSSAVFTGTSEQSSRKGLLKSKTFFRFAFAPTLTLRIRYFP